MGEPEVELMEKKGSSFLGCCCDMRRAVIILSSVDMGIILLRLYIASVTISFFGDDERILGIIIFLMYPLSVLGCVLSLIGAIRFSFLLPVSSV